MKELIIFCCLLFAGFYAEAFVVYGEPVALGQGKALTYVDIDHKGKPLSVGMILTEKALQGLPTEGHTEYVLKLPAILNVPPYNHMVINWEPHGHEPENIYGIPHFDFHFYFISNEMRQTISCMGDDRAICLAQPTADKIPPFYIPTPEGVPQMGWHWVDPRSPEFNGKRFTTTFIYGFYGGNNHFIEPMITREYLLQKPWIKRSVPVPQVFAAQGYFPQAYTVRYDSSQKVYLIALRDFLWAN